MRKLKFISIFVVIIIIVVITLGFFAKSGFIKIPSFFSNEQVIDIKTVEEKLQLVSELITLTYAYSNVAVFSDEKYFSMFGNDIQLFGTKKSFIITYDGVMKFGIDLSKISISSSDNTITIKLPDAKMFSHEIKEDSISLLDEKSGLFNSFSMNDYTNLMIEQKDTMEMKASQKDVYSQVLLNAESQIELILSSIPGLTEQYEIQFVK